MDITLSDKQVDYFHIFSNPMMKSIIISYTLALSIDVKIEIRSEKTYQIVKELYLIAGNPGGRKGENKVLWDGTIGNGLKVPYGKYSIQLYLENSPVDERRHISF